MNRCVEENANDPGDSFFRYLAPLTKLRFEPLSQKRSPPDHVYSHHKISLV